MKSCASDVPLAGFGCIVTRVAQWLEVASARAVRNIVFPGTGDLPVTISTTDPALS
jgi:hypothetical protein